MDSGLVLRTPRNDGEGCYSKLLVGLTAAAFIGYDIAGRPRVGLPFEYTI
jgi:hypothetical protein